MTHKWREIYYYLSHFRPCYCIISITENKLIVDGVRLFTGGHKEFHRRHKELCEDTLLSAAPASAPTTPTETAADIESHPASRVLPWLYVGNARDAADPDTLRALGVNRVLNVTASPGAPPPSLGDGVTCRHLPAADTGHQNLKQYFDTAFQFIGEYHNIPYTYTLSYCLQPFNYQV